MDTLKSIWEDFSDRFKSPFVISFIISWTLWNWWLVYSVLNFDAKTPLEFRLNYIQTYLSNHYFIISIIPLFTSFLGAAFFYATKLAFLWLDTSYENKWRIEIIKRVGLTPMIPKEDLISSHEEIELLNKQLDSKIKEFARTSAVIQELQTENIQLTDVAEKLEKSKSYNQKLQNEIDSLKTIRDEIKQPESLKNFFDGTWFFEYNLIDFKDSENPIIGHEKFFIKNDEYVTNGKMSFVIKHIKYYESIKCLTFLKEKPDSKNFSNKVTIFKIEENLWSGIEITSDQNISYVRFYSSEKLPNTFPLLLPKKVASIHDSTSFGLYFSNFKNLVNKILNN